MPGRNTPRPRLSLMSLRGISTITAMIILAEVGDLSRSHPRDRYGGQE